MGMNENTQKFALIGVIMIILSVMIGIWVTFENREMGKEDADYEDTMDAQNRTGFFFSYTDKDFDNNYLTNPVPGYSGFNFYILMGGITFLLFAFQGSTSRDIRNAGMAKLGLIIVIISILLAAWVSYNDYMILREVNEDDPDQDDIRDRWESTVVFYYINSVVAYLGPAVLVIAVTKDRMKGKKGSFHGKFLLAGICILIVALILAAIGGMYTRQIVQESQEDDPDNEQAAEWFTKSAFISHIFPYIAYLGLGVILYPLAEKLSRRMPFRNGLPIIPVLGISLAVVGLVLAAYPAMKYHEFAEANEDLEKTDFHISLNNTNNSGVQEWTDAWNDYSDAQDEYIDSAAYGYYASSLILLGLGLMVFFVIFGRGSEGEVPYKASLLNIAFCSLLVPGMVLGFYSGYLLSDIEPGKMAGFFSAQYLFMIIMFSSIGLMLYNWTRHYEVFSEVRHYCSDCGDITEYYPDYGSHYCETCGDWKKKSLEKDIHFCRDCGMEIFYVLENFAWYCNYCEDFKKVKDPLKVSKKRPGVKRTKAPKGQKKKACRICREPMEYVDKYDRWYCHTCGRYAGETPRKIQPAEEATEKKAEKAGSKPAWKKIRCPECGKEGKLATEKRPITLKCTQCGKYLVIKK